MDSSASHMDEAPPVSGENQDQEVVSQPKETFTVDDFFNSVRFGSKSHVNYIIKRDPGLVNKLDSQGYSCMHWAAKRGDVDILEELHDNGAPLDLPASFDTQMRPIHWAASDGKLTSMKFLLDNRQDINSQDRNGCSPVIIAAQYGKVEMAIYLIKNGADLNQRDVNGDTALHWGGYKGFEEIIGVLMHFVPHFKDLPDNYGQTPLHLAALRGNNDAVAMLVTDFQANPSMKDKNGLTPLALAVKKEQVKTEWILRRLTSKNTFDLISTMGVGRLRNKTILSYLIFGCTEADTSAWIWRVSVVSNFIATYSVVFVYMGTAVLSDYITLHLLNVVLHFLWWILFFCCLWKTPGFVPDEVALVERRHQLSMNSETKNNGISQNGSQTSSKNGQQFPPHSYDAALVLMGSDLAVSEHSGASLPAVCHSCRVQKPLRSKHCKIQRKCVCKFDHFCPFVFNTVGRDNYKYFVSLLLVNPVAFLLFLYTTCLYWHRTPISWIFTFYLVYACGMNFMVVGLAHYHMRLICKNMTTNEEINQSRYTYFKNEFSRFDNPFHCGSSLNNFLDGMFPSSKLYYSREEVQRAAARKDSGHDDDDEDEGHFEEASSKLLPK